MADEKQTTSDLDDWLEDLDDSEEFSGELDQENIDALLSGGLESKAEKEEPAEEEEDDNASFELDQANIDALLGGSRKVEEKASAAEADEDASVELDQANIDALLGGSRKAEEEAPAAEAVENASVELDQANIDALLGQGAGGEEAQEETPAEAAQDDGSVEMDQANIDALLGGAGESAEQLSEAPAEQEEAGSVELDQANIDLLLGEDDDSSLSGGSDELDQDNIDALLSGADSEEKEPTASDFLVAGPAKGGDDLGEGLDVDQDEIDQLFSGLDDDEEEEPFPSEEMDIADVLEGDDDFLEVGNASQGDATSSGDTTLAGDMDDMNHDIPLPEQGDGGLLPFLPESLNKTFVGAVAVCLVLLIVSGVYFFRGGKKEPAINLENGIPLAQMEEPTTPPAGVNHSPVVSDSLYAMPEAGGEVPVSLAAKDDDNDAITFEVITPPQHGRLSGDAPELVYLPNNDFPGEDRFEYKASDGKESSELAKVIITGPDLAKLAEEQARLRAEAAKTPLQPSRPEVYAKNKTYDVVSTDKVTIDWARIWREANDSPFSTKVHVDIDDANIQGSLTKIDKGLYVYRPNPNFSGDDVIHYRFKQGGLSSGLARLTMEVSRGDLPPEIRIGEMASAYAVGETVRIDVSPTRDEARGKLSFRWEQISGVPVQMKKNNEEGSIITFAMPSSFYTSADPGPVLRVTAVDAAGQSDSRVIKVGTISRRNSALWGMADNNVSQGQRVNLR